MNFRIIGQRTGKSENLCKSCQHSVVTRMQDNSEIWRCCMFHEILKKPVADCQRYYPQWAQSVDEISSLAYIIDKEEDGEITIRKRGSRIRIRRLRRNPRRKSNEVVKETIQ